MDNAENLGYEQSPPTPYIPATPYMQVTANADGSVDGSESRYPDRPMEWESVELES